MKPLFSWDFGDFEHLIKKKKHFHIFSWDFEHFLIKKNMGILGIFMIS
jgi:hypothetical protein